MGKALDYLAIWKQMHYFALVSAFCICTDLLQCEVIVEKRRQRLLPIYKYLFYGTTRMSVCSPVCMSHVGISSKQLNASSLNQLRMVAQKNSISDAEEVYEHRK